MLNVPIENQPLFDTGLFHDIKDPCPVWDGKIWHLYGSGGSSQNEIWKILHATSLSLDGPWQEQAPATLDGVEGNHVAAPGLVYNFDTHLFNMFVQTDFMALGTAVERLISADGQYFERTNTVLESLPEGTDEAGIYDPHPALIHGQKYLTYSGTTVIGRPNIYIAQSTSSSWKGPWMRKGVILKHEEVAHHNQLTQEDYEWGLEGSQLLELPNGQILLNCVCFLPEGARGTRERIFFAISDNILGPYKSLGPILNPTKEGWASGENGHASGLIIEDTLHLFYQARTTITNDINKWRYGHAKISIPDILDLAQKI